MIYSYFELIFSIILLLLSVVGIILVFVKGENGDGIYLIPIAFVAILGMYMFGDAFYPPTPTKDDVLNKKAEYIETIHITGNDTIKTYKIEWINN